MHGAAARAIAFLLLAGTLLGAAPGSSAAITGASVALSDTGTGQTSTATVTFTIGLLVSAPGRVLVTFPAGFDVSGANGGTCTGATGPFTTSVAGQVVTIAQTGVTAISVGQLVCTIDGIVNPTTAGATGTYTIATYDFILDGILESLSGVSGPAITASALASTNVEPASLLAGATGAATVGFTTVNAVPLDGVVEVTFPAGFDVSGANGATCGSMDGAFATGVAGQVVSITRSGGTAQAAAAESCSIGGIRNPQVSGSTGTYSIRVLSAGLAVIDQDLAVTADTIVANALGATSVTPADASAGATSTATAAFTTLNPVPADGVVEVTFPADYDVSGVAGATCSSMDGTFTTGVAGQVVSITRNGDGSVEAAGAQTCSVPGVVNPGVAGTTGTYALRTLSAALAAIDVDLAVPGTAIGAGALSAADVQPASLLINAVTTNAVTFTSLNPVPADGVVQVTYPAGFDVSGANGGTCSSMDGTFTTGVAGQVVTITRNGDGTIEPPGAQTCSIAGIRNPATTGAAGTYTLRTLDGALATVDELAGIAGDTFVRGGGGGGGGSSLPILSDGFVHTFAFGHLGIDSVVVTLDGPEPITMTAGSIGAPDDAPGGFVGTPTAFELFPETQAGIVSARITILQASGGLGDGHDLVLLHGVGGTWEPLPTTASTQAGVLRIEAVSGGLSPFWLVQDVEAPTVEPVQVDDGVLSAAWSDNQERADAVLLIDGEEFARSEDGQSMEADVSDVEPGEHEVLLTVTDPAGHQAQQRQTLTFEAPAEPEPPAIDDGHAEDAGAGNDTAEPGVKRYKTPGPGPALVALSLVGLAALVRRRL